SSAELEAIRGAGFTVEAVQARELVTEHDVAAFVDVLAESAGEAGRWIHYGLTSSDVLDTALALQLRSVGEVILPGAWDLVAARTGAGGRVHSGRRARPPRRAAAGNRPGGCGVGAAGHGDPPSAAHRGERGAGAVPGRSEGLERDAAQAQPDQERADLRPRARAAGQRASRARGRGAVARARYLALLGRACDPARLDDPAR